MSVKLTADEVLDLSVKFQTRMDEGVHEAEGMTEEEQNEEVLKFAGSLLHMTPADVDHLTLALGAAASMTDPRSAALALLMLGFELRGAYEEKLMMDGAVE